MDKKIFLLIGIIAFLLLASILPGQPLYNINWALFSVIIICLTIASVFWSFEKAAVNSRLIALIASMASFAAISRIVFSAIASVQPLTFIVMICGYVFGPRLGFMVGAISALVSNFFLGQGPWTPWQMFSWGLCGVLAAILARRKESFDLISFAVLSVVCAYIFGLIMNSWHWMAFVYPLNLKTFTATYMAAFVFDSMHAVGNVLFAVIFGKSFYQILSRYKRYI